VDAFWATYATPGHMSVVGDSFLATSTQSTQSTRPCSEAAHGRRPSPRSSPPATRAAPALKGPCRKACGPSACAGRASVVWRAHSATMLPRQPPSPAGASRQRVATRHSPSPYTPVPLCSPRTGFLNLPTVSIPDSICGCLLTCRGLPHFEDQLMTCSCNKACMTENSTDIAARRLLEKD
jgi:hypothetical protein